MRLPTCRMASLVAAAAIPIGAAEAGEPGGREGAIRGTRHDLSVSGRASGNEVAVEGVSQVCVFCHTPHKANPDAPLWNREGHGVTYTLYSSSTLRGVPEQPSGQSRLCLSCHDGTVAVGKVKRRPRGAGHGRAFEQGAAMMRLAGRPASLGTDLTDDHPIMIEYEDAASENDELTPRSALPRELRLAGRGTVHCTTCHDPHCDLNKPFLVLDNSRSMMCVACHSKRGWQGSIHATAKSAWLGAGEDPFHLSERGVAPVVSENACESCHRPHTAAEGPRLLKAAEEALCLGCHSGTVAPTDVGREFDAPYGHRVRDYRGIHDAWENIDPVGEALDGPENDNRLRHVECADCHDPHATAGRTHEPGTSLASEVLRGTSGVALTYGAGAWLPPSYRWIPAAAGVRHEYEICMKCHSSWQWESLPPRTTDGVVQTDVAVEFNPGNASYHAVVGESRASAYGDYEAPWSSRSRMYCSDCHRGAGAGDSSGAHGSRVRFLLAGEYDRSTGAPGSDQHLCFRCHRHVTYADPASSGNWRSTAFSSSGGRNLHALHAGKTRSGSGARVVCRDCHAAIPHGLESNRALVATQDVDAPYRDPDSGLLDVTAWPLPQSWGPAKAANCSTAAGCH